MFEKGKKDVIEEFGAETKDIKELAQWLKKNICEKVAMENTFVYVLNYGTTFFCF